ncbi:MAG: hypothetical protein Tsb002_08890 [Wenzhouxiangellaceae bacterium]
MGMKGKRFKAVMVAVFLLLNTVIWVVAGWAIESKIGSEQYELISQTLVYGGTASLMLGLALLTGLVTR